ncbi:MAG TPA: GNAT family N-acetyltransferase [Streptosporangiaceae bacterium]|nr:GNAT family N-acetyltransferase [Streptosporangiaceae bacterium]
MALVIRSQEPGDGDGLARVWQSAGRYYAELAPDLFQVPVSDGPSFELGSVPLGKQDEGNTLRLVAEADGTIAGWLSARLEPPVPAPERQLVKELGWPRLMVDALVVDRSLWRQGIGGALLSAAEQWGRERGANVVRLDTYADGPVAVPFYEQRMGYHRRAIIFEKKL